MSPSHRLLTAIATATIGILTLTSCGNEKPNALTNTPTYNYNTTTRTPRTNYRTPRTSYRAPRTFTRPRTTTITTTRELRVDRPESPIYHSSKEWGWLSNPGKVIPGGQIINTTQGGLCSAGWIVGLHNRRFILTAGHCGHVRDQFAITDQNGNRITIGEMVESTYIAAGSADYGLIELYDMRYVNPSPPFKETLKGWRSAVWLDQQNPRVCHLGYRTGQSCGDYLGRNTNGLFEFRGYNDHGDSGGPVYSIINGQIYAVGIISYRQPTDATRVGAQDIGPAMKRWGLTIYAD